MGRTFAQTSRFEKTAVDAFAGPEYMSEKQIRMYNLVGKHKSAKSGFVTSYSSPKSGKALLNEERNFAAVRKLVESEIDYVNRG